MSACESLQKAAETELDKLQGELPSRSSIVLASTDGFEVAARGVEPDMLHKLAAMACSLSALGAMASEETSMGRCLSVTVETSVGYVVIVEVVHPEFPMTLQVIAPSNQVLAQVLYLTRRSAHALSKC